MSRLHYSLVLCVILPFVTPQCTINTAKPAFSRSAYEFSIELLRRIAQENDNHFVTSTLSPWMLLTAVSYGAADETLSQIQKVLHHSQNKCFNNKYLEVAKIVASSDRSATLEKSAAIFIDQNLDLKPTFKREMLRTHVSKVTQLSFEDFAAAALTINEFVKTATKGVIEEIVTPSDLEGVYLMMIDALYFKGSWRKAFSIEDTETSQFFDYQNKYLGDVRLMFVNGKFNITQVDPIKATVLELPYGDSNKFSMLVFLPNEGVPLVNVIDDLQKISLLSIFAKFRRNGPQTVMVQLPRFKISSDLGNLKELLIDMGLRDMFDPSRAQFPFLSSYELHVASFIQKADIEVTETGTVAAAVTELGMGFRSSMLALEFVANKPFLFMVVDREAQVAVFSGAYSKPSLY